MKKLMRTSAGFEAVILRLVLGIMFFAHGAQKLLGWFGGYGLEGTIGYFESAGIPAIVGYLIVIGEFFGGLGLIVGFLTRVCAAAHAVIMIGAISLVHSQFGYFMNWTGQQAGEGYEFHLLALAIALALLIVGAGPASIDRAVAGR